MANFIQYGGLANGLTQGFNSMMGLARVKMEQQRMEQQQKQQELRNDLGMFKVLTGIQADKSQPMEQKQESLKQIVDIAGKYNPEMAKRLSAYKFHEMPDAQPIFKRMDDYIKNHTDEEITTAIPMFANELIKAGQDADLAEVTLGGVVKMRQAEKTRKAQTDAAMQKLNYGHKLGMIEIKARHENEQKNMALKEGMARGQALAKEGAGGGGVGDSKQITALKNRQASQIASINALQKKHNVGNIDINALVAMKPDERKEYLMNQSKPALEKIKGTDKAKLKRRYRILEKITDKLAGDYGVEERTVVRTGKIDGRNVIEYSDGAVEYAD